MKSMSSKTERPALTDDYIRSKTTVTTKEAAAYLGMSWWTLTDMLQTGKASFGVPRLCPGGTWSYTIWGERLFRFKQGLENGFKAEAAMLAAEAKALNDKITELLAQMQAAG